ncbi:MAG: aminoacetone oxidase family FAD-binding enzyme [Tissierellia bacterium]|nr:aminoacetone oxidase family FAD-binding enzyme [Tissierellia bacterium]
MKIIIIGAGVSSLALTSFITGDVSVYEKNKFSGRKLLATGNGRCNFTNRNLSSKNYHSTDKKLVLNSINNFGLDDILMHFDLLGIETTSLESGRYYPKTMSSKTVRDMLYLKAIDNGIDFNFDCEIEDLDLKNKRIKAKNNWIYYDKLVIATGGKSLKNSGSDGKIADILKNKEKIEFSKISYGICSFDTKKIFSNKIKGTRITAKASLFVDKKFVKSSTDDIIFQDYGLTGTAIFNLSNLASKALSQGKDVMISVDLIDEYNENELYNLLLMRRAMFKNRNVKDFLKGLLHDKLIDEIVKIANLKETLKSSNLSDKDLLNLTKMLKKIDFKLKEVHEKDKAQVTMGGVSSKELDMNFSLKKYPEVFIIGELTEISGDCGGYNIHWAFASAYMASLKIKE